ncbi:hypothetical protein U1Q18_009243 [Sarracenia purpurea var. burkii]
MAGTVYLKTDKFEVKLEGITFKLRDFESLSTMDFLFPKGRVWLHPPVVGIDVIRHPRDVDVALLLLCFGIGCVILKFHSGDSLPDPVLNFLQDQRISFVGFGIPEKKDLFPFDKLGLKESKVDVGFLAAKVLNDPKLRKCELADLARRVLGIKKMVGMAEARSLGRHERIKRAICEVFVSSVIASSLLNPKNGNNKQLAKSPKKSLFPKSLDLPSGGRWPKVYDSGGEDIGDERQTKRGDRNVHAVDDSGTAAVTAITTTTTTAATTTTAPAEVFGANKPLKGILKCSSSGSSVPQIWGSPDKNAGKRDVGTCLRRANSKGYNVSFVANNSVRVA